nr:hypothetical protein Iba_chr10eCG14450 [Ipomoea batatas]
MGDYRSKSFADGYQMERYSGYQYGDFSKCQILTADFPAPGFDGIHSGAGELVLAKMEIWNDRNHQLDSDSHPRFEIFNLKLA